ncbi:MAG TPA: STAS domain-containing protein [Patescibacteria group bacterium]|nr:STAS domain-containing protein [Patescibacteria group bacterium]
MRVDWDRYNGLVSMTITGKLGRETDPQQKDLSEYVSDLSEADRKALVFDLSNVTGIDTYGIGQMIYCQQLILESGGKSCWVLPKESASYAKLRHLLDRMQLSKVFIFCDTIQDGYQKMSANKGTA